MKIPLIVLLIIVANVVHAQGQYPFEKFTAIKFKEYEGWDTYRKADRTHFTLAIPEFFENKDKLTIQLTTFDDKWDSSFIRIFRNKTQVQKLFEPMFFTDLNIGQAIKTLDVNGDSLNDLKITVNYMGCGIAGLNTRVIYLFQQPQGVFTKISYTDKEGEHFAERDFDNDGNFEILTMTLVWHENHSYWLYNVYNFSNGQLVNQNDHFDYPIMIQYLFRENFKITDKISRAKMKTFAEKMPGEYSRN